jgi:2-keto-3-deoxy-L-arabinonate dehydratase
MDTTPRLQQGIHAILYALFDAAERLDRAAMRAQAGACLAAGCRGIAVLGLAIEVAKLASAEQVEPVHAAKTAGAAWVILQPPLTGTYGAAEHIRFEALGDSDLVQAFVGMAD